MFILRSLDKNGKRVYRTRNGGWSTHRNDACRYESHEFAQRVARRTTPPARNARVEIESVREKEK